MSEPLTKVQKVDFTRTAQSYDFTYRYEDDSHPTAPTQVDHGHYTITILFKVLMAILSHFR